MAMAGRVEQVQYTYDDMWLGMRDMWLPREEAVLLLL